MLIRIRKALLSLYDKLGLQEMVSLLAEYDVEIISTGNTYKAIKGFGQNVTSLSEYTGFSEILEGRVKTLHPKVHAGLLASRDNPEHVKFMELNHIAFIDLVIVNFYPFNFSSKLENIDVGGPAMVRAAAKNYNQVCVIPSKSDYEALKTELRLNNGSTTYEFRRKMACNAFFLTAQYDSRIAHWLCNAKEESHKVCANLEEKILLTMESSQELRYGENPHQKSKFYISAGARSKSFRLLHGKKLSYNNMVDADSGIKLVNDFSEPTAVIIKHNNPCGVGSAKNIEIAYQHALECDPLSSFGGVVVCNRKVNKALAEKILQIFTELVAAPGFSNDALTLLSGKRNLRLLISSFKQADYEIRSVLGGFLVQTQDNKLTVESDCKIVSKNQPMKKQIADMIFAQTVCKHVKSNAVVVARDLKTLGIGSGQMSRIDSVKIALSKNNTNDAALASDGFLPFADSVIYSAKSGISAILQPGGSIRDQEVIDAANNYNITMMFTGCRHFKH